ncbi:unnamed protein product [Thlaspi arvense]|uniref:Small auxin up regulated protein n=1 Tax=Thlaspi arvense TaxID=13288 RepID=A0AAU9SBA8_THLAR|nr:unnamed protein product [Thlaspi arvense]
MRNLRVFKLGRNVVKIFKWAIPRRRSPKTYQRLNPPSSPTKHRSRLRNWGRGLYFRRSKPGYVRSDGEPTKGHPVAVPKGHLAVYVGEREDDAQRYLVPVIYFNHPLFGDLLKEAEKVYGYNHPGGIQIPCRVSEFESVQTQIAAGGGRRRWRLRLGRLC